MSYKKLNLFSKKTALLSMLFLVIGVFVFAYFYFDDDAEEVFIQPEVEEGYSDSFVAPVSLSFLGTSSKNFYATDLYEIYNNDKSKFKEDYVREYYPSFLVKGVVIKNEYDFGLCGRRTYSIGCGRKVDGSALSYIAFRGVSLQSLVDIKSGDRVILRCHKIEVEENGDLALNYCHFVAFEDEYEENNEQSLNLNEYNPVQAQSYLDDNNCQVVGNNEGGYKWSDVLCNQSQYGRGYIDGYNKIEI